MWPKQTGGALLGVVFFVLALVILFIWVPMDTDTDAIYKFRRQIRIGDAMAPSFAAALMALAGLLLLIESYKSGPAFGLNLANLCYVGFAILTLAIGFLIMRFAGPLAVGLFEAGEYRLLRDTAPWKYLGFCIGGTVFIYSFIFAVERKVTARGLAVALLAPIMVAAFYDLPFDDLLLPPNGDFR